MAEASVRHCCADMTLAVAHRCEHHPSLWDCPDYLVHFSAGHRFYGLVIHDGGESVMEISFCPWCGTGLDPAPPGPGSGPHR